MKGTHECEIPATRVCNFSVSHDERMDLPPVEPLHDDMFKQLVDKARDCVVVTEAAPLDEPGPRIVYVNEEFTRLTGYTPEEVLGRSPRFLQRPGRTDPQTLHRIRQLLNAEGNFEGAVLNFSKDDDPYWLDLRIFPLHDAHGKTTHFAAIERDITERTLVEMQLRQEVIQDPLTGLLNRRGFEQVAKRAWKRPDSPGGAVIMVDLDKFKMINDTAGHAVGDQVLQCLGKAVLADLRDTDYAVRFGGDEFGVLLPGARLENAIAIGERIRLATHSMCASLALVPNVTVSVGVAATDHTHLDEADLDDIAQRADVALYRAKQAGGDRVVSN